MSPYRWVHRARWIHQYMYAHTELKPVPVSCQILAGNSSSWPKLSLQWPECTRLNCMTFHCYVLPHFYCSIGSWRHQLILGNWKGTIYHFESVMQGKPQVQFADIRKMFLCQGLPHFLRLWVDPCMARHTQRLNSSLHAWPKNLEAF